MTWRDYRGFVWAVAPGMCCPSIIVRATKNGETLANVPHNDFDYERKATQIIDSYCENEATE